jgi:cell filamentation protein
MDRLFAALKQSAFLGNATLDAFVIGAAHFLAELNAIHPFREGNGRAQTTFLVLLAIRAGRTVDLDRLRPTRFLAAMIASFDGSEQALRTELRRFVS